MEHLQQDFEVPQRRACRVLEQPRSTQRYSPQTKDDEPALVQRMHEWVRIYPRYGYLRITHLLRAEGWRVNHKRVYRLWKQESFGVPQTTHKKRRLGCSDNGIVRQRASPKDHVWPTRS